MKRWTYRKSISLPGGFVIKIVEGSLADKTACWDYTPGSLEGVITLDKGLTQAQQRYYLSHELIHAMIDYHHIMIMNGGKIQ